MTKSMFRITGVSNGGSRAEEEVIGKTFDTLGEAREFLARCGWELKTWVSEPDNYCKVTGTRGAVAWTEDVRIEEVSMVMAAAQATADRVIQYEAGEGRDRDDALKTPEDVREYADRFGWLDDVDDAAWPGLCDLPDDEFEEFERTVTDLVIEALPKVSQ